MDQSSNATVSVTVERLKAHGLHEKPALEHHTTLRRASVLVLLANDGKILLTQRSLHLRSHPGEVCFPGGKQDEADIGDDWTTALRETLEEVGLEFVVHHPGVGDDGSSTQLLERLSRLRTLESINHLCVTPLVGFVANASSDEISSRIQLNATEVEQYFWAPLEFFINTPPVQEYDVEWSGEIFVFRKYMFPLHNNINESSSESDTSAAKKKEIPITGLTAHIAREVAEIAALSSPTTHDFASKTRNEYRGFLWRLQDHHAAGSSSSSSSTTMVTRANSNSENHHGDSKLCWSQRYFILSGGMLHQYDSRQMAERKSQSATKKNRLKLMNDDSVHIQDLSTGSTEEESASSRYAFRVSVLDGRITWKLAASCPHERSQWKQWLLESTNMEERKS